MGGRVDMKKPRGGQKGNLNAAKHPWTTFWRRRALKAEDRWILPILEEYNDGLRLDKPGMTAAEKRMAELAQLSRGCTLLILGEVSRSGFTTAHNGEDWDLTRGAKELPRFMNAERSALLAIGLERKTRDPLSLDDYMAKLKSGKTTLTGTVIEVTNEAKP